MGFILLFIVAIAWIVVPAVLIGWIFGFWNLQIIGAALWACVIIYFYIRARLKSGKKFDSLTYTLASIQACAGGAIVYFVALATH